MWVEVAPGWTMAFDRGPDWLFARISPPPHGDSCEIALCDAIWERLEQAFTYRVVVEMEEVPTLHPWMADELAKLYHKVHDHDGVMRLCGLSDNNQCVLDQLQLSQHFPQYRNRSDSVMGYRPMQPR